MTEELTFEPAQIGVHVAPFGTGRLEYTFDDADASEFVIGFHYPGHYDAGMRAIITISGG